MKIQLDFDNKTMTLESNVDLGIFIKKIKYIVPDYKEWTLNTNVTINWNYPIIPYTQPSPYWPTIMYDGTQEGIHNIEMN